MSHRRHAHEIRSKEVTTTTTTVLQNAAVPMSHGGTGRRHASPPASTRLSRQPAERKYLPNAKAVRPSAIPRSTSHSSETRVERQFFSKAISEPLGGNRAAREGILMRTRETAPSRETQRARLQRSDTAPLPGLALTRSPSRGADDDGEDAVLGIALPQKVRPARPAILPPRLIPELQALASTHPVKQDSQRSASSVSSASARYSESPSPWSVSTTMTTPTSWSSASPGLLQYVGPGNKRSHTVPVPTNTQSRLPRLPVLQESRHSSVESRIGARKSPAVRESTSPASSSQRRAPLTSPIPTPPPRTSSAKRTPSKKRSSQNLRSQVVEDSDIVPLHFDPAASPLFNKSVRIEKKVEAWMDQPELSAYQSYAQPQRLRSPEPDGKVDQYTEYTSRPGSGFSDTESRPPQPHRRDSDTTSMSAARRVAGYTTSSPYMRGTTPSDTVMSSEDDRPPSRSRLGKFAGLGLFGRQNKEPGRSPAKLQRKGPAAGTGHEGYGKQSRGRKASTDSAKSRSDSDVSTTTKLGSVAPKLRTRSISTRGNRSSQSDLDDFAASRMKPVAMVGGSQRHLPKHDHFAQGPLKESNHEQVIHTKPGRTVHASEEWLREHVPHTLVPSTPLQYQQQWPGGEALPTLAMRRSQKFGSASDRFPMPTRLVTASDLQTDHDVESRPASHSSSFGPTAHSVDRIEVQTNKQSPPRQPKKKSRKLRWNPFRRKESPSIPAPILSTRSEEHNRHPGLAVVLTTGPLPRSMPYYAMMGSETDIISTEPETIGGLLAQAIESPHRSPQLNVDLSYDHSSPDHFVQSPKLAFAASGKPDTHDAAQEHVSEMEAEPRVGLSKQDGRRQPRLAQVGRIPKVVSRNELVSRSERQHNPNRTSFSRPFQITSGKHSNTGGWSQPQVALTPTNSGLPLRNEVPPLSPTWHAFTAAIRDDEATPFDGFLSFPKTALSEYSTSTNSEGTPSLLAAAFRPHDRPSGALEGPRHTKELPKMLNSPDQAEEYPIRVGRSHIAAEDEVWNEYDDFLDHVLSPVTPKESNDINTLPELRMKTRADLHASIRASGVLGQQLLGAYSSTAPRSRSPAVVLPYSALQPGTDEEFHLRRSRIVSALHSSIDPASPFSIEDYLGDEANSSRRGLSRISTSSAGQPAIILPSLTTQPKEYQHQEKSKVLDLVERTKDPIAQSELHYTSLMVSRWLSFGRVLFSPGHDEILQNPQKHVLVIDGLGNEDWSLYCAVTYEAQKAFIHDLREVASTRSSQTSRYSGQVPPNYRRAEIPSLGQKFPFPERFFSVVVLRFPTALPDRKMQNILTECKRVLTPGGYIEMMILDLDIVNAGVHTRRWMRELKINMTTIDASVSLKPIIDNVQNLLGTNGFSSLNRCIVGVPVAGRPISLESSSSSGRGSFHAQSHRPRADPEQFGQPSHSFQHFGGEGFSLNDLVADRSDNADAKIGRMVSRTARSWWQHSFESAIMVKDPQSKSMFTNKEVLKECKARASSFKLLIGHAQKPTNEVRRRTMSEPSVPTVATVGAPSMK